MSDKITSPKVFISYSWKPQLNQKKTIELAERLMNNGIHVILDVWDLKEGHDKYTFMEAMVTDADIRRVLIICNKDYKEKANSKKGGVGTESMIMSGEIYKKADQTKFVPIIFERDEDGKEYLPVFIHSRMYIDLSNEETFEDNFEALIRNIIGNPIYKRPVLGTIPQHLLEEEPTKLRTAGKVKAIKNALLSEKKNYQVYIDDYYDIFLACLEDFELPVKDLDLKNFDDDVFSKMAEIRVLKDDFIDFFDTITKYSTDFNVDRFVNFLERLLSYIKNLDGFYSDSRTLGNLRHDHFRLLYYEMFLNIFAILFETEKFQDLSTLLYSSYFVQYNKHNPEYIGFSEFNFHIETLNHRNSRLGQNYISPTATLLKERVSNRIYTFEKLQQADTLLFFLNQINKDILVRSSFEWYPYTVFSMRTGLPIRERIKSKKYFEKIKPIFKVDSATELIAKVNTENNRKLNMGAYIPQISYILPLDSIATIL